MTGTGEHQVAAVSQRHEGRKRPGGATTRESAPGQRLGFGGRTADAEAHMRPHVSLAERGQQRQLLETRRRFLQNSTGRDEQISSFVQGEKAGRERGHVVRELRIRIGHVDEPEHDLGV
uniref:hypothetical protein n=1 Tax=Fodinicola feengrottensis TaxID=435914 RepID=UPI0013D3F9D7